MLPNIKESLETVSTEKLITQLLRNSLAKNLLLDRVLRLDVPDTVKVSLLKSAASANGIESVAGIVTNMDNEAEDRSHSILNLINWDSIERANREEPDTAREQDAESHVYFIESEASGLIKIGRSIDPTSRFKAIRTMSPDELVFLGSVPEKVYSEADLHKKFAEHRKHGEWFDAAPEIRELIAEVLRGRLGL